MVIQKFSIEGAYDEAIEDAATRIYEASRPQNLNADNSCGSTLSDDDVIEKNDTSFSPPSDSTDDNSEETITFGGGNSSDSTSTSDNYTDDDDIESNILYLEEKKQILKKAKIQGEKEEAYIALNAHDIANGREPSSRRKGSSTIWSEAKAIIEEFKMVGGGGASSEEEQGNTSDLVVSDIETRESNSSHSTQDIRLSPSPSSPSPPENRVKKASLTRKRRKIDLSMVKCISSAEFAKDCAGNCFGATETENDDGAATRSSNCRQCVSPTGRWQQASEMQLSMASRNWISETVLKQILALTAAAISQHRCSVIGAKNGE